MFFEFGAPFIPVIFWLKALITWLYMVIEVMVAAPFWVCSHALPEGKGFAGSHARRGYLMFMNILIRPVLLVMAALTAYVLTKLAGQLLSIMFNFLFMHMEMRSLDFWAILFTPFLL